MQQKWPKKLTKPKSPFTTISTEPPEIREKRIKDLKPNKKFHDFHTIQWLRHRYSNQLIQNPEQIFSHDCESSLCGLLFHLTSPAIER